MKRLVLKHGTVLPLPKELHVKDAATWNVGVTYVHEAPVYIATDENVNLNIRAADCYIKTLIKPSPLH